jgi:polar amino acid transport system substrate-binding protein
MKRFDIPSFFTLLLSLIAASSLSAQPSKQTRQSLDQYCLELNQVSGENAVNEGGIPEEQQSITVFVDNYPPYIMSPQSGSMHTSDTDLPIYQESTLQSSQGSAAKVLSTLGQFTNTQFNYHYIGYGDGEKLLRLGKKAVSYPYFFTAQRAENYVFSCPIAYARVELYFSRQHNALSDLDSLNGLKIGVVKDNSYGAVIDGMVAEQSLEEFDSELSAIVALAQGRIDVLPMAKGVMDSLIKTDFPAQKELIKPFKKIFAREAFRVMAARSVYGEAVINNINQAISLKFMGEEPGELTEQSPPNVDLAELIPAEGFPAIIGVSTQDNKEYTLPIGTRVIVLDWSDGIRKPNSAASINRSMLLTSKVVVLNGPHVSKEMLVRNMHIQLK